MKSASKRRMTDYKIRAYADIAISSSQHWHSAVRIRRPLVSVHAVSCWVHGRHEWSTVVFLRTPLLFHDAGVETRACQSGCRAARNGRTTVSAYQRRHSHEQCFLRQATRALHFAALAAPETTTGLPRPVQSRGGVVEKCNARS
jgi:hypothetical protein